MMARRRISFVAGLLTAMALVGLASVSSMRNPERPRSATAANTRTQSVPETGGAAPGLQLDLQANGPFGDGEPVDLAEAESISGFDLPPAPETDVTGSLTSIWVNESASQVAYVWASDLRLYVSRLEADPASVAEAWDAKAAEAYSPFDIVPMTFARGIGAEASATNPSSLLWLRDGYEHQFVGPKQSLAQLVELAEKLPSVADASTSPTAT